MTCYFLCWKSTLQYFNNQFSFNSISLQGKGEVFQILPPPPKKKKRRGGRKNHGCLKSDPSKRVDLDLPIVITRKDLSLPNVNQGIAKPILGSAIPGQAWPTIIPNPLGIATPFPIISGLPWSIIKTEPVSIRPRYDPENIRIPTVPGPSFKQEIGTQIPTISGLDSSAASSNKGNATQHPTTLGSDSSEASSSQGNTTQIPALPQCENLGDISNPDLILINAYMEIDEMAEQLNLSKSIVDRACDLFKQVHESFKERRRSAITSACLYIACREANIMRARKSINDLKKAPKKKIEWAVKDILVMTNIVLESESPQPYVHHYCCDLGLPQSICNTACSIFFKSKELRIASGSANNLVVAASIFMACQVSPPAIKRSLEDISTSSGLAVAEIQQTYMSLYPLAAQLFPENFEFDSPVESLPKFDTPVDSLPQCDKPADSTP